MAKRRSPAQRQHTLRGEDLAVVVAATTEQTRIRWRAVTLITAAAAFAASAWAVTHADIHVSLGLVAGVSATLTVTLPPGLAKILWDRTQKKRLRERVTDLEQENEQLRGERDVAREAAAELRGEMKATRGKTSDT